VVPWPFSLGYSHVVRTGLSCSLFEGSFFSVVGATLGGFDFFFFYFFSQRRLRTCLGIHIWALASITIDGEAGLTTYSGIYALKSVPGCTSGWKPGGLTAFYVSHFLHFNVPDSACFDFVYPLVL